MIDQRVENLAIVEPDADKHAASAPKPQGERPAHAASRVAAALLDVWLTLLLAGPSVLMASEFSFSTQAELSSTTSLAVAYGALPAVFVLAQLALLVATGRTVGHRVLALAAVGSKRASAGLRALPLLAGLTVAFAVPTGQWWTGLVVWFVLSLEPVISRLSATRLVVRDGESGRAFEPPHFSARAFLFATVGLVAGAVASGVVRNTFERIVHVASTEVDVPLIAGVAVFPLVLVLFGALSAYRTRRFVVGELALTSLLAAVTAFQAMALGLLPVPALQRFEVPGALDFGVYSLGLYFVAVLFLVIGSGLGFMVASDDGTDFSTQFERLVARRHLRLQMVHWLQLAVIATLVPILVYGVVIWPVRAVWRLVKGRKAASTLPPTVFMALLTIVGVMFGVMSLTVVLAVMGGFERDLKEKILGTNAHGVVHRYVGEFTEWRDVSDTVGGVPGIKGVTPFILSEVMITTDDMVTGAVLKGIDVDTVGSVTDLARNIDPDMGNLQNLAYPERIPRPNSAKRPKDKHAPLTPSGAFDTTTGDEDADEVLPGLVIGREMARTLRVWMGDKVTVMNPLGELGPNGPIPRSRVYRIAAVFVSGMYEYDSKFAYLTLGEAQSFFRMGDQVSGLEVRVTNVDDARPIMRRVLSRLEGFPYRTKDWGEMNENLFAALRLERVVMFVLLSFQVLIACICVIATLVMLVVEKRREVAVLKAMGAREGSIMKLFVLEGLIIGAIGTFYGSAAGFLFCKLIEKYGVGLDPQVYYIERLPVVIDPGSFVAVGVVAMLLVFIATLYPARRGGSIAPVEGFREE